ncbi:hypothetical protein P3X46_034332 [Hevea brasiliensis]|uniref:DDE Tnp4 domain-containing protein n=1 Tax=Hevea brasiliensis TaxID=3981 RepID=A0ABQ9KB07_HEVBR|nr:hypothetical protein P3X46_034332 [Hevea brasiliensis]
MLFFLDLDIDIQTYNNDEEEETLHALDDDDETWQLVLSLNIFINIYIYIYKETCMVSYQSGLKWLLEVLQDHLDPCINIFRMDKYIMIQLFVIFLYTLVLNTPNRHTLERFQHSGETISQVFRQVLHVVCLMSMDIIKPIDPEFSETPPEILNDRRYMPHFKDFIGAIDGTHVRACIAPEDQIPYIGRKGIPTQNIIVTCSFDMQFTFVWAGCEGTAHDAIIFLAAIKDPIIKFPKPPKGKYYLVDVGYPNMKGYLKPYKDTRYHLWHILDNMPAYPFKVQMKIVVASMALHNYIRKKARGDRVFQIFDRNPEYVPFNILPDIEGIPIDTHIQR